MHTTKHAEERMSQRGIDADMLEIAKQYGEGGYGDKTVLSRKEAQRLVREKERELRALKRILAKGGIALVAANDSLITAYEFQR